MNERRAWADIKAGRPDTPERRPAYERAKRAHELGANVDIVRLGCLFHDIGKVIEGDGSHVKLGVDYLKRFNFPEAVIDAVALRSGSARPSEAVRRDAA